MKTFFCFFLFIFHSIPRNPTPIPRIPTLIPHIPTLILHIPTLIPCIPNLIPCIPTLIPHIPPRLCLRRRFPPQGLHRGILNSSCVLILLIHTKHKYKEMKSWTNPRPHFLEGELIHLVDKKNSYPDSSHSPHSQHSHPHFPHSHPDSPRSYSDFRRSHHFPHSVSRFPISAFTGSLSN